MLDRLAAAHEALRGAEAAGMSRVELADAARALARLKARVCALEADVAGTAAQLPDKATDTADLLRSQGKCSQRAARKAARRAAGLASMPNTMRRLGDGDLSEEHVDALIAAATQTSFSTVDADERLLDTAAARPADLASKDIRAWVQRHRRAADEDELQRRRRADRRVSIWTDDDGMIIVHGAFDPVAGVQLKKAIEAETDRLWRQDGGREGAADVRTPEQRRADAVLELCAATRQVVGTGGAASARNQLLIIAEVGAVSRTDPGGRREIADVGPIPQAELERLACQSILFGLLFDGNGLPLWHGRETRLATDAQFRAMVARDGGCVLCDAAPQYCEAHHILAWQPPARGPTDIDNLALVCVRHHHWLHEAGQVLVRTGPSRWQTRPDPHTLAA